MNDIVERLRAVQRQYAWSSTGTPVQASVRDDPLSQEAADEVERLRNNADNLRQEIEDLRAERDALKTVMIAAAEEIHAHWEAHCDADGYGPSNLMRRLEEGIPSEYGYTAGAFEQLRAERDALKADAERYRWLRSTTKWVSGESQERIDVENMPHLWDAAIDAARKA